MKRVTIQDIAQEMQLSRNTVAKALHDGAVSYETKISVLKKAQEMGYTKLTGEHLEQLHGTQMENSGKAVLVLSGRSQEKFWSLILAGISGELNAKGYRMLLQIVDEEQPDAQEVRAVLAPDVAGLIFLNVFPVGFVKEMAKTGLPTAFFDAPPYLEPYLEYGDVVYSEGWSAMEHMVQELIDRGYRRFGYIGYPDGTKSIHDRYDGYLHTLWKNGLKQEQIYCHTAKIQGDYYDYHVVERLVDQMESFPEVYICANDAVAKNVASALYKRSPELEARLVLTGFDHTIEPGFFRQDIYSVDVNKEDLGKRLAKSVLDRIREPMEHALITVRSYPDLIENYNENAVHKTDRV